MPHADVLSEAIRQPVVAGRFYPGDAATLTRETAASLALAEAPSSRPTLLAMAPHAGAVYSGPVAGRTLGAARLADTLLLLGPNHTGRGARLAVWPSGAWRIPGQDVPVDAPLAAALLEAAPGLRPDREAHLGEHSLEVLLPFLRQVRPQCRIVPVAVAEPDLTVLAGTAAALAGVLAGWPQPVSVIVSSDMSHYVSMIPPKSSIPWPWPGYWPWIPRGFTGWCARPASPCVGCCPWCWDCLSSWPWGPARPGWLPTPPRARSAATSGRWWDMPESWWSNDEQPPKFQGEDA